MRHYVIGLTDFYLVKIRIYAKTVRGRGRSPHVWIYDVKTGKKARQFGTRSGVVSALGFSPDGTILATGGWDNTARLWNLRSGDERIAPRLLKSQILILYGLVRPPAQMVAA